MKLTTLLLALLWVAWHLPSILWERHARRSRGER